TTGPLPPYTTLFRSAETDVLQQQRIRIVFIEEAGIGQRRFHFILIDQCIHRHIDAYAVAMGIPDRLCNLFSVKVPGKGTGTKGRSEEHTSELQSRFD